MGYSTVAMRLIIAGDYRNTRRSRIQIGECVEISSGSEKPEFRGSATAAIVYLRIDLNSLADLQIAGSLASAHRTDADDGVDSFLRPPDHGRRCVCRPRSFAAGRQAGIDDRNRGIRRSPAQAWNSGLVDDYYCPDRWQIGYGGREFRLTTDQAISIRMKSLRRCRRQNRRAISKCIPR